MADKEFEYDSGQHGSRNRQQRRFAKKLLIGLGIAEIICGVLLIGFGAGATVSGSKLEYMNWAPFVGGFLTIFVGMVTIFVAFRKENSALIFTAVISVINAVVVGFLVIFAASEALIRDSQCIPGSEGQNTCDRTETGAAVAMDAILIVTTMFVIAFNAIAAVFCIRIAVFTHHEDRPHVVVT